MELIYNLVCLFGAIICMIAFNYGLKLKKETKNERNNKM